MKKRLIIIGCIIVVITAGFIFYNNMQVKEYKKQFKCFDTLCEITIYSREKKEKELKNIVTYASKLENELQTEITDLNKKTGQVVVSKNVVNLMNQLNEFELYSNNQTLTNLWKEKLKKKEIPTVEELKDTFSYTNNIKIEENTLTSKVYDINIDAYGFGFLGSKIKEYLNKNGISSYMLNFGGNIMVGKHYKDKFHTAILEPISNEIVDVVEENNVSIYTIGEGTVVDGIYYVPIINPNTKYPYNYHKSVTVMSKDPVLASLLSYKLFTLNLEDGKTYLEEQKYEIEKVFWIENDGEIVNIAF